MFIWWSDELKFADTFQPSSKGLDGELKKNHTYIWTSSSSNAILSKADRYRKESIPSSTSSTSPFAIRNWSATHSMSAFPAEKSKAHSMSAGVMGGPPR